MDADENLAYCIGGTMSTVARQRMALVVETQQRETEVADELSYFVDEAAKEFVKTGQGLLLGVVLGGGLWIIIIALGFWLLR